MNDKKICSICDKNIHANPIKIANGFICEECHKKLNIDDKIPLYPFSNNDLKEQINHPNNKLIKQKFHDRYILKFKKSKKRENIVGIFIIIFIIAIVALPFSLSYFSSENIAERNFKKELTTNFPYTEQLLNDKKIFVKANDNYIRGKGIRISFYDKITKEQFIEISTFFSEWIQKPKKKSKFIDLLIFDLSYPENKINFEYACIADTYNYDKHGNILSIKTIDRNISAVFFPDAGVAMQTYPSSGNLLYNISDIDGYIEHVCANMLNNYILELPQNISIDTIIPSGTYSYQEYYKENLIGTSVIVKLTNTLNTENLTYKEKVQIANWVYKQTLIFLEENGKLTDEISISIQNISNTELSSLVANKDYIKSLNLHPDLSNEKYIIQIGKW